MDAPTLESLADRLPESAKDLKLNLSAVLGESSLTPDQRWGVALASAWAARHRDLAAALLAAARNAGVGDAVVEDARAAAALMAMNNVFYRFRHMVGREIYAQKPARLRMNRIGRPATSRADFELFSLAVSAINGCEACVRAHEHAVREGGLTEDQVLDAVRVASVVHGVAVALEI